MYLEKLFTATAQSWITPVMFTVVGAVLIVIILTPIKVRNEETLKVPLKAVFLVVLVIATLVTMWSLKVLLALS